MAGPSHNHSVLMEYSVMSLCAILQAHWITSSDPNLRQDSLFTSGGKLRPASDSNLRDIRSLSSQSPSVSCVSFSPQPTDQHGLSAFKLIQNDQTSWVIEG